MHQSFGVSMLEVLAAHNLFPESACNLAGLVSHDCHADRSEDSMVQVVRGSPDAHLVEL